MTLYFHYRQDNGSMSCQHDAHYDDEATFVQANPWAMPLVWTWRLPTPLDAWILPTYPQARVAEVRVSEDGSLSGWLHDPDTPPPADVLKKHEAKVRRAARHGLLNPL